MVLNSLKKTAPLNGACKGYFIASKAIKMNKNENLFIPLWAFDEE